MVSVTAATPTMVSSPTAVRLRRPGWRDPRLLLGIVLVALSVLLGSWLVSTAGRTSPVYVADGPLVAGEPLTADRLVVREVRLVEGLDVYLSADEPLADGLVAVRTVGAGELVPVSAVAVAADLDVRPVAITPAGNLSSGVVEGSRVDLWFVPDAADGAGPDASTASTAPRELAEGLTVAEVSEPNGTFSVGSAVTVHVLVPVDVLPTVLTALAADGSVEVVHVPGALRP